MATAYVKNDALSFYSEPNVNSVITKIERSGQTEAHFLSGFSEGDTLGVLTGEEEDGFVQIEYKFDIRRKVSSTKKWLWILPPAGLIGSQLSQWTHETEKIWVLAEDITDDKPPTEEEIANTEKAKKKAAQDKLLAEVDKNLAGSATPETKSNNTVLIAAIAAAVAVLGGVLWWAFGKKKDGAPAAAQQPTIIQLPKSPKR